MLVLIFIIVVLYLLVIGSIIYGFDKVPEFNIEEIDPKTNFSILIPFRNEAENLPMLLNSIVRLNYPKSKFEIIFVDDDSTDHSKSIINNHISNFNSLDSTVIPNVRLTKSPKKDAITSAIVLAKYDWIITSDADCQLQKFWLDAFDNYIQNNSPKLVVAPVTFSTTNSFFERFQLLDILSLQGATIGGFGLNRPFLCNGANLGYKKAFFNELNGFIGNSDIASGDDIFMLEKAVKQDKHHVHYIKSNHITVFTKAQNNFKSLKSQRIRWAAKTTNYRSTVAKLIGLVVLIMNALLVCLPLLYMLQIISLKSLVYTFAIKILIDFLLIYKSARFFNQEQVLPSYFISSLLYPFFSVYVAFVSVFKGYTWKGRAYAK